MLPGAIPRTHGTECLLGNRFVPEAFWATRFSDDISHVWACPCSRLGKVMSCLHDGDYALSPPSFVDLLVFVSFNRKCTICWARTNSTVVCPCFSIQTCYFQPPKQVNTTNDTGTQNLTIQPSIARNGSDVTSQVLQRIPHQRSHPRWAPASWISFRKCEYLQSIFFWVLFRFSSYVSL